MDRAKYLAARKRLSEDNSRHIRELQIKYSGVLTRVAVAAAPKIFADFGQSSELLPFWLNYSPAQRGRAPKGTSIPWSEVGEKTISFHLAIALSRVAPQSRYPGLPFGGD